MTFPLNKEDWYLERDNRTCRVTETQGFENFKVGIVVSDEIKDSFQCQIMVWIITNILARWCRYITIQISSQTVSELNFSKGEIFKNSFEKNLLQIDPYLTLEFNNVDENKVDAVCLIGNQTGKFFNKAIWIDCDGWLAGIGKYPKKDHSRNIDKNILGASFAACLGCSELFRRATGKQPLEEQEQWYSLWDFKKTSNKNEFKKRFVF